MCQLCGLTQDTGKVRICAPRTGARRGRSYGEDDQDQQVEREIGRLVRTRLSPDKGDNRHPEAVLRSALHTLFQSQPELRRKMVTRTYTAGEMTGVSHEEMKQVVTEGGAEILLGPRTVDEVLRDAESA